MLDKILPPSTQAAGVVSPFREARIPSGWPGTHVPNFSDWRPGDIVLVQGDGSALCNAIELAQSTSPNASTRAGRSCTHAALYVDDGMVVDATKGLAICEQSVWNYCQTRALQVRRLNDPSIPAHAIADIARIARQHIGEPYAVLEAILSRLFPRSTPNRDALYCSTLVGLVIADATGVELGSDPCHQPLHPGTLAGHDGLVDVPIEWRQL